MQEVLRWRNVMRLYDVSVVFDFGRFCGMVVHWCDVVSVSYCLFIAVHVMAVLSTVCLMIVG